MSSGDACIGATTSNTASQKILQHGNMLLGTNPELQAVSAAAGYSQNLYDQVLLTFDITPTVSGPLAFQFVLGSEEHPMFSPTPGEAGWLQGTESATTAATAAGSSNASSNSSPAKRQAATRALLCHNTTHAA